VSALSARDGYRLWAPTYSHETAISHLETRLVAEMTPPLRGLRLLDAGCGTGRRLVDTGAAMAVGVDLSPEMLDAGIGRGAPMPGVRTLVGDVNDLPLPDATFDVVWCRLVIGHLAACERAYAELARVAAIGAHVIVTDFHTAAHDAGHRRTFRDGPNVHEIVHHVHTTEIQRKAALAANLAPVDTRAAAIGPEVRAFYDRAGRTSLYEAHEGLPVVSALAFRRVG
jgi:malonyl-CoA O-methyltransferase